MSSSEPQSALGTIFGSFVGAALGIDLAGVAVNLASSGIEAAGKAVVRRLTSKSDHDLEKLVVASFAAAAEQLLQRRNAKGSVYWRDSQKDALGDLKEELTRELIPGGSARASALLDSVVQGSAPEIWSAARALVEPYLAGRLEKWRRDEPAQWDELCTDLCEEFFAQFQRLYQSEDHARGRAEFEREVAWSILQAVSGQAVAAAAAASGQAKALEEIRTQLERVVQGAAHVTNWVPPLTTVVDEIRRAESRTTAHITRTAEDVKQSIASEIAKQGLSMRAEESLRLGDELQESDAKKALAAYEAAADCAARAANSSLEAKAVLRAIQVEINEHAFRGVAATPPFDRWKDALRRIAAFGVRVAERLLLEARIAVLQDDLETASARVRDGRAAVPPRELQDAFTRLAIEILTRRSRRGDDVKGEVQAEESRLRTSLEAQPSTEAVLALVSLAEIKVSLGALTEADLAWIEGVLQTPSDSPLTRKLMLACTGRLAARSTTHALGERIARAAFDVAVRLGGAVDRGRAGDLVARYLRMRAVSSFDELVALRRRLCDDIVAEAGPVESLRGDALGLFVHHRALGVIERFRQMHEGQEELPVQQWIDLIADASATQEILEGRLGELPGGAEELRRDVLAVCGEAHATLGEFRAAGESYRNAAQIGSQGSAVQPARVFGLVCESAHFFCAAGDTDAASAMHGKAAPLADDDRKREHLRGIRELIDLTQQTQSWLRGADAESLRSTGEELGIRAAIRPTIAHMFGLWDDLPSGAQGAAGALYDYWGRGSFLRVCAAVRASSDDAVTVDADSLEGVASAARVLCPLFETVVVKWKGPLEEATKGLTFAPIRKDRGQSWLYGSGLVHCGLDDEHYAVMGRTNELPLSVIDWMRTEARPLVESGRLFVVPAQLVGCAQRFTGAGDALFASGLLGGALLGAGREAPISGTGSDRGILDLATVSLPYFAGVGMRDLSSMLDDVGADILPFRRRMFAAIADEKFVTGPGEQVRRRALKLELEETAAELDRVLRRARKGTSLELEASSLDHMAVERTAHLAGTHVTEWLTALVGRQDLRTWVPFLRLRALGGRLRWSDAPAPCPLIRRVASLDLSWLAPPTIGAGMAAEVRPS